MMKRFWVCFWILVLLPAQAIAEHNVELALQDSTVVAEALMPSLLKEALRSYGYDPFDFEYPGIPKTYVGRDKVKCPLKPWHKEGTNFWVEVSNIHGSIGVGRDNFDLSFSRNQAGRPLMTLRFFIPAQIHAVLRVTSKSDCWSTRTSHRVRLTGLRGELRSSLAVENGKLILLDRHAMKMSFQHVRARMVGGDMNGIITENLLQFFTRVGKAAGGMGEYVEKTIVQALADPNQMKTLAGAIVDAANNALSEGISFEERAELFNEPLSLRGELAKVREKEGVLLTHWATTVEGPAAHRCAEELEYRPRAAHADDVEPLLDLEADFNLRVPTSLLEDALTQTIRAGAYCGYGFHMPYRCEMPVLDHQVEWCFGVGGLDDQRECMPIGLPGGSPGAYDREGPYVEVEFGGRLEVTKALNRAGDRRPVARIPVRLRFHAAEVEAMNVLLVAQVGFRLNFDEGNKLRMLIDPQTTEITFLAGKEEVEEIMCDNDDALEDLAFNAVLGITAAMALKPITLITEMQLPIADMQLQVRDTVSFGDRFIHIPFDLECGPEGCDNEMNIVPDCPAHDFDPETLLCRYEINASCPSPMLLYSEPMYNHIIDAFMNWDVCKREGEMTFPSCMSNGTLQRQEGRDQCEHTYTPSMEFREG